MKTQRVEEAVRSITPEEEYEQMVLEQRGLLPVETQNAPVTKISEQISRAISHSDKSPKKIDTVEQAIDVLDVIENGVDARCYSEGRLATMHTNKPLTYNLLYEDLDSIQFSHRKAAMKILEASTKRCDAPECLVNVQLRHERRAKKNVTFATSVSIVGAAAVACLAVIMPASMIMSIPIAIMGTPMLLQEAFNSKQKGMWCKVLTDMDDLKYLHERGMGDDLIQASGNIHTQEDQAFTIEEESLELEKNLASPQSPRTDTDEVGKVATLESPAAVISESVMTVQEVMKYKMQQ